MSQVIDAEETTVQERLHQIDEFRARLLKELSENYPKLFWKVDFVPLPERDTNFIQFEAWLRALPEVKVVANFALETVELVVKVKGSDAGAARFVASRLSHGLARELLA